MAERKDVRAFVDWNSQIINAGQAGELRANRRAERTLEFVAQSLAECVMRFGGFDIFRVSVRGYHGWYSGLTPTDNRRALMNILRENDAPARKGNVLFGWNEFFGDRSLCAFDHRLNKRLQIHFPDTLRRDFASGMREREKMVDTALAADLLFSARSDPQDWRIVMAEDDDTVPAVYMAERWSKDKGGRTLILRRRRETGHLALDGLLTPL